MPEPTSTSVTRAVYAKLDVAQPWGCDCPDCRNLLEQIDRVVDPLDVTADAITPSAAAFLSEVGVDVSRPVEVQCSGSPAARGDEVLYFLYYAFAPTPAMVGLAKSLSATSRSIAAIPFSGPWTRRSEGLSIELDLEWSICAVDRSDFAPFRLWTITILLWMPWVLNELPK